MIARYTEPSDGSNALTAYATPGDGRVGSNTARSVAAGLVSVWMVGSSYSGTAVYSPVEPLPTMPKAKPVEKCRRCVKRVVGRVGDLCGVCRGMGRR
jgi:hypothetical protein